MTPPAPKQRYRKLPGHLRLIFGGSSVWAGDDHLLLVRSSRFAEKYKRYYFSDIQGIAVAESRRWHVSTRAIVLGWLWLIALGAANRWPKAVYAVAPVGALLFLAWLLISILGSCRCRIYTAVSNDELPSVYRRWTARRFLAAVEPLIAARQGAIPANWAELAEEPPAVAATAPVATGASRTFASDLLIVCLFLTAGIELVHWPPQIDRWTTLVGVLSIVVGSVFVMVHRRKGLIQSAMQTLAVVTLVTMGLASYGRIIVSAGMAGYKAAQTKSTVSTPIGYAEPAGMRPFSAGLYGILGIVGVALSMRSSGAHPKLTE